MASINFKRIICELFGKNWSACNIYWDTIVICKVTSKRANAYCQETESRRIKKSEIPPVCTKHTAPPIPPPPVPKYWMCVESGLAATRWCPDITAVDEEPPLACRWHRPPRPGNYPNLIVGIVDPHCRADFTDAQVDNFALKIGKAGVDYVRVFTGWEPTDFRKSPFLRTGDGRWDLYKPNPAYDALVQRFQRALAMVGVGILWDISGCQFNREDYAWSFFNRAHNIQGIDVYDYDARGIEFWKYLIDRIIGLIGIEGNRIGLGNEQQAPGDFGATFDKAKVSAWARGWGRVLVDHLLARGIALPYSFSASRWTGKELYNRVCKLDNGDLNPARPWSMMCQHLHGMAMPEHYDNFLASLEAGRLSIQKHYGISDDGVDGGGWNDVPADKRGPCGPPQLATPKCTADWKYRIQLAERVRQDLGDRLKDIEFMPRTCKGLQWNIDDLDQVQDVDVWPKVGELYGVDICRS